MKLCQWTMICLIGSVCLLLAPRAAVSAEKIDDNEELRLLMEQDQKPRREGLFEDKEKVKDIIREDAERRKRVMELYQQNAIKTGKDFYNAALILQHGDKPEDFLLAHEFCVAALALGNVKASWLAAASEDRFLQNIGRQQRFGTQFTKAHPQTKWSLLPCTAAQDSTECKNANWQLMPVQDGVTDYLRRLMNCPILEEAREREKEMNRAK